MKKAYLILLALLVATLAVLLPGCTSSQENLEGMYVVTFDLNGGKIDLKSTEVQTVKYAYEPDSTIIDPAGPAGSYKLILAGYDFTGWYTSKDCKPGEEWDFKTGTIKGDMTLYAGWAKKIVHSFTFCYVENGEVKHILNDKGEDQGRVIVAAGATVNQKKADMAAGNRKDFTPIGYFTDVTCKEPFDFNTKHPGGDQDTDVLVYVQYIPGNWTIVKTYSELVAATGDNIYLANDIDCEGQKLDFGNYGKILEGNGFTIRNFTVDHNNSKMNPGVSIFKKLNEGAQIRNVNFENVTFNFVGIATDKSKNIKVAALAESGTGFVVENVSVTGTIVTDYTGEMSRLNEAFYEESTGTINNFNAEITVSTETES